MRIPVGMNAAFALTTGAMGKRLDPYLGCNFLVELDGLLTGGFSQVEGLESSIEVEERAEGGVNGYTHKVLKRTSYPNLVLTHGLTSIDTLWRWYDQTSRGVIQRKSGTLMLLDAQRIPVMWWDFRDALPVKWSGPAFNAAEDSQVAIERVELIHRGISRPLLSALLSAGHGAYNLLK
ncbi:phage tail protein [Hyalangium gracile]|uniref:phage tail protein n=1 Tax=Hyalangium gracile TaxID=394092 RepID=UPI001CCA99B4|nr:phage tail protein [Hyalangium gracile]